MDHDRRARADQILKAIEYGHIPKKEIERRLYEIIDSELSGPLHAEWDRTKVDLCHELLWELYTNGEEPFPDNAEEIKERVAEKHSAYKRKKTILKYGLRVAAIVIILIIVSAAISLLPSVHWFQLASTPDEEQVLVTGREVTVQSVASAISDHYQSGVFSFSSKDELIQFLGFDPGLPDSLNTIYLPIRYDISIDSESIRVICQYRDPVDDSNNVPLLSVRITMFPSTNGISTPYEQDAMGEFLTLCDTSVYRYSNVGKTNYLWTEDHTIVRFLTTLWFEESEKYVEETIRWRKEK